MVVSLCDKYPEWSDQKISDELKKMGCPIARRTVTKYRTLGNVSASYDRGEKQEK